MFFHKTSAGSLLKPWYGSCLLAEITFRNWQTLCHVWRKWLLVVLTLFSLLSTKGNLTLVDSHYIYFEWLPLRWNLYKVTGAFCSLLQWLLHTRWLHCVVHFCSGSFYKLWEGGGMQDLKSLTASVWRMKKMEPLKDLTGGWLLKTKNIRPLKELPGGWFLYMKT